MSESLNARLIRERQEIKADLRSLSDEVAENTSLRKQATGAWVVIVFVLGAAGGLARCSHAEWTALQRDLDAASEMMRTTKEELRNQRIEIDRLKAVVGDGGVVDVDHEKRIESLERWRRRRR